MVFDLAINQQQIQLCYSPALLAEYERVLSRSRFDFPKDKVKKALEAIKHRGIKVEPQEIVTLITRDPQDNRILETAQAAQADYIITGNKQHFSFKQFKGSKVVSPREFITKEGANIR